MPGKAEAVTLPSVKDLASSEPSLRRTCLKTIITYLNDRSASHPLTHTECLQLWRGFYVALYMHDSKNALSVQRLIAELAGTVSIMDEKDSESSSADDNAAQEQPWLDEWTAAFWETVCREWASIDQWRMNKVLLLVRFFIREQFNVAFNWILATETSEAKVRVATLIGILEAWPLSPRARNVPDGLRLHVLDIWADEVVGQLEAAQSTADEQGENGNATAENKKNDLVDTARTFMEPIEKISKEALSKGVKMRAKEAITVFQEKISG